MILRSLAILDDPPVLAFEFTVSLSNTCSKTLFSVEPCLNTLSELDFLLSIQERNFTDLLEIILDGIRSCTSGDNLLRGSVIVIGVRVNKACAFFFLIALRAALTCAVRSACCRLVAALRCVELFWFCRRR